MTFLMPALAEVSALDLDTRAMLDTVDLSTRVGSSLLALGVLALAFAFVRAEVDVPIARRAVAMVVAPSGALTWAAIAFWYGGGWVVAPGSYGVDGNEFLFRVLLLVGAGVGAALLGFLGLAILAIDDL